MKSYGLNHEIHHVERKNYYWSCLKFFKERSLEATLNLPVTWYSTYSKRRLAVHEIIWNKSIIIMYYMERQNIIGATKCLWLPETSVFLKAL
jgi:hypothetical protein